MIDVSKIIFGVMFFFVFVCCWRDEGGLSYCVSCSEVDYIAYPTRPPFSLRKSIKAVGPGPLYQFRCSERLWIIEAVNGERERRENKD